MSEIKFLPWQENQSAWVPAPPRPVVVGDWIRSVESPSEFMLLVTHSAAIGLASYLVGQGSWEIMAPAEEQE